MAIETKIGTALCAIGAGKDFDFDFDPALILELMNGLRSDVCSGTFFSKNNKLI